MTVLDEPLDRQAASTRSLRDVLIAMLTCAVIVTLLTAPFAARLGTDTGAVPAALHGLSAFPSLFVGTIGLYLGWYLVTARLAAFGDLQHLARVMGTRSRGAIETPPLIVVAAFILWRHGAEVLARPWLRYTVAVLLARSFFYLVVAFGVGTAVVRVGAAQRTEARGLR